MTIDQWTVYHCDLMFRAASFEQHVLPATRDQPSTLYDAIIVLCFFDLDLAKTVEPGSNGGGKFLWHVVHDEEAGRHFRQCCQYRSEQPSVERKRGDTPSSNIDNSAGPLAAINR